MSDFEDDNILVDVSQFKEKVNKSTKISLFKVIARSFFSVLTLSFILVYLLSPMGKVKINQLSGNYYLDSDKVIELAGLSKRDSLLKIREDVIMNRLNESSYIASSNVSWHMTYLDVEIDEVAPMAKSNGEIILSNGISLDTYRIRHLDYEISKNLDLPEFINYSEANYSSIFLNALKRLDKNLFKKVKYLDEAQVITKKLDSICFGVYFEIGEDLFRIQIQKSIILEGLGNKDALESAINSCDEKTFSTVKVDELGKEVYEAIYYYDGVSYKIVSLKEGSRYYE